ncbi:hypothetical protein CEXT_592981 [Caerostris extrusa]|uniref:Uncharacterized protein n=1 Tax=Caerostris extrusa TaxID=172846 RepID=A0AAV4W784_CAEEX|nr:hypothetical protein CEXT_592981 [Caerostris extrusa]
MSTKELYSKVGDILPASVGCVSGSQIAEHVWVGAEVKKFEKDELEVEVEDGSTKVIKVPSNDKLPPLRIQTFL